MPRTYRMGERLAQMEATRERIIEAAIELSIELGISGLTMREVGRRADVAPGTLRNHFSSRDDLERAMVERLTAEAALPELSVLDDARSIEERLDRLIRTAGAFFDRSLRLQQMWLRERMLTPAWNEAGAAYGARWEQLFRTALGPLADDPEASSVIQAVVQPSFFDRLRTDDRSTDDVATLVIALITPWFVTRSGLPAPGANVG